MNKLHKYQEELDDLAERYPDYPAFFMIEDLDGTYNFCHSQNLCLVCIRDWLINLIQAKGIPHLFNIHDLLKNEQVN